MTEDVWAKQLGQKIEYIGIQGNKVFSPERVMRLVMWQPVYAEGGIVLSDYSPFMVYVEETIENIKIKDKYEFEECGRLIVATHTITNRTSEGHTREFQIALTLERLVCMGVDIKDIIGAASNIPKEVQQNSIYNTLADNSLCENLKLHMPRDL